MVVFNSIILGHERLKFIGPDGISADVFYFSDVF